MELNQDGQSFDEFADKIFRKDRPPAEGKTPQDDIGAFFDKINNDEIARLNLAMRFSHQVDPQKAARALRLRGMTGAPLDLILSDVDEVERIVARKSFNAEEFRRSSPFVARYIKQHTAFASLAQEDLPKLVDMEALLRKPRELWPRPDVALQADARAAAKRKVPGQMKGQMKPEDFALTGLPSGFEGTYFPTEAAAEEHFYQEELEQRRYEEEWVSSDEVVGFAATARRRARENPAFLAPFLAPAVDLARAKQIYDAAVKLEADPNGDHPEEVDLLVRFGRMSMAQERRGTSVWGSVVAPILTDGPAFALESGLSGGVYAAGKGLLLKGGAKAVEGVIKRGVMTALAARGLGLAAMTAVPGAPRVAEKLVRRMTPGGELEIRPDKSVGYKIQEGSGEPLSIALPKAFGDVMIEYGTERMGKYFHQALFGWWLKKAPDVPLQEFIKAGGIDDLVSEWGEERAANALKAMAGIEAFKWPSLEESAAELLAFGILQSPGTASGLLSKRSAGATPGGAAGPAAAPDVLEALKGGVVAGNENVIRIDDLLPQETRAAARAATPPPETNPEYFKQLGEAVKGTKIFGLAPDQLERIISDASGAHDQENVYAPIDSWVDYWSKQKDEQGRPMDPRKVAESVLGSTDAYDRALQAGADLPIPTGRYAIAIAPTEHNTFFQHELRQGPNERNARESQEAAARKSDVEKQGRRLENRAVMRFQQREGEVLEEAKRLAKTEARAQLQQLIQSDIIAQLRQQGAEKLFWREEAGGGNVEELTKSGIPRNMIANPALLDGPGVSGARAVDEVADNLGMTSSELVQAVAEAFAKRQEASKAAQTPEARDEIYEAVADRVYQETLQEVEAEAGGSGELVAARVQQTMRRRLARPGGYSPQEADAFAELTGRVFRASADRANVDPLRLFKAFGPEIRAGGKPPTSAGEAAQAAAPGQEGQDARQQAQDAETPVQYVRVVSDAGDAIVVAVEAASRAEALQEVSEDYPGATVEPLTPQEAAEAAPEAVLEAARLAQGEFGQPPIEGEAVPHDPNEEIEAAYVAEVPFKGSYLEIAKQLQDYFRKNLQGTEVRNPKIGRISIVGSSRKQILFGYRRGRPLRAAAVVALPQLLERAVVVSVENDLHGRDEVDLWSTAVAPLQVGDKLYAVKLLLRSSKAPQKKGVETVYHLDGFAMEGVGGATSPAQRLPGEMSGATPETLDAAAPVAEPVGGRPQASRFKVTVTRLMEVVNTDRYLFQPEENEAGERRAGYVPPEFTGGAPLINLYRKKDLSSYLHEGGHLWLDMLAHLAAQPGVSAGIVSDFDLALKWMGVPGVDAAARAEAWRKMSFEEREPFHEKWARGVERYFFEGKAPTPATQSLFDKFSAWLTWVYKKVSKLNVEITPEIRGVMDRLVATEAEIAAAQELQAQAPIPAKDLGLKPGRETDEYIAAVDAVKRAGKEQLAAELLAGPAFEMKAAWKEEYTTVRADVETMVNEQPVYVARAALQRGTLPDGSPLPEGLPRVKLDQAAIVARFGGTARLKKLAFLHAKQGGIDPDTAAERFRFANGEEMIRALETAEPREALIDRLALEQMREKYGTLETDAQIAEMAMDAVHNELRGQLLGYQLTKLASRFGGRHTPRRILQEQARADVLGMSRREMNPSVFQRAEAKAAAEVLEAAAKGEGDRAIDAQERAILNHEYYRAAVDARRVSDDFARFMSRYGRKAVRQKLGRTDYLEQLDYLRDRFGYQPLLQEPEGGHTPLAEWIRNKETSGESLGEAIEVTPRLKDEGYRTHWADLPHQELLDLKRLVEHMEHLATVADTMLSAEKKAKRDDARGELIGALMENGKSLPLEALTRGSRTKVEGMKAFLRTADTSLLKTEQLMDWFDGGRIDGPWHRYLWNTSSEAQNAEYDYTAAITAKIAKAVHAMPKEMRARLGETIPIPGSEKRVTRRDALGLWLNRGNSSNWSKSVRGEAKRRGGLNEQQMLQAIEALTKEEKDFGQGVWDTLESMWPDIARLHKELTGLELAKVKVEPIETKDGTYKGGYYPMIYDRTESTQGEKQLAARVGALQEEAYVSATLSGGHRKAREEGFSAPVDYDIDNLPNHTAGVIKDLTHRKWMIDANWITQDAGIRAAIQEYAGAEYVTQLTDWTKRVVNDRNSASLGSLSVWRRAVEHLRYNTMIAAMGFKAATVASQVAGIGPAIEVVGAEWFQKGLVHVYAGPKAAYQEMIEISGEMRHRRETKDRDLREQLLLLQGKEDLLSKVKEMSVMGIGWADLMVSTPTWWAGYLKGLAEGLSKKDAGFAGDRAVRLSQGAGAAKDLASVQAKQDTLLRVMTMFYTPFSALYSRLRDIGHGFGGAKDVPAAAGRIFWVWIFSSTVAELASGKGPDPDDEDETWLTWWLKLQALYPFLTVPLVRDVANGVAGDYGYQFSPIVGFGKSTADLGRTAWSMATDPESEKGLDDLAQKLFKASGYWLGVPTGQLQITGEYLLDLYQGDVDPDGLGQFGRDLIFRRPKSRNRDR